MRVICVMLALAAAEQGSWEVGDKPDSAGNGGGYRGGQRKCDRVVEPLVNTANGASYMGVLMMGSGEGTKGLVVIWDTGSDQQVVNSVRTFNMRKPCFDAQTAKHCFNFAASSTYKWKKLMPKTISYGSGDTMVLEGQEKMELFDG